MRLRLMSCAGLTLAAGCGGVEAAEEWAGTIDTLPSGMVVVTNPERGMWREGAGWRVVEEIRIGAEEGDGPEVLGQISVLAEDAGGRIWALESADQVFKVFGPDGRFVRTVGRKGGGPGEMRQVSGVAVTSDGRFMVVDPQGARVSVFDTAGGFLRSFPVSGGFVIMPWPGGLDTAGYFYNVVPRPSPEGFAFALVRHDTAMTPLDTLTPPRRERGEAFTHRTRTSSMSASVPFAPSLQWRFTRAGDFWAVQTGTYELFRLSARGDTIRRVTKPFQVVPVAASERDEAVKRLKWFTDQGGNVDPSRIPGVKPAVQDFLVADDGYLWVNPVLADTAAQGWTFEVFDPEGRFLGVLRLPFELQLYPRPVVRGDRIIAMTQDSLGVPYIVRARIER